MEHVIYEFSSAPRCAQSRFEHMWHVIFGYGDPLLLTRNADPSVPLVFKQVPDDVMLPQYFFGAFEPASSLAL